MRKTIPLILSLLVLGIIGCTTTAQTEFYRPPGSMDEPYRIGGKMDPMSGWAGEVYITINDELVIQKKLPAFTNTTEVIGEYEGKSVIVLLTRVQTFGSNYVRADVTIGSERAASLTF
jgi:hypothetical protein